MYNVSDTAVQDGTSTSITLKAAAIDWTVYNVTGDSNLFFSHPRFGAVRNLTESINFDAIGGPGNSTGSAGAKVSFGVQYRCITGTYSRCPAGLNITDGDVIEACYPEFVEGEQYREFQVYAGIHTVNVGYTTYAASLGDNPNAAPPADMVTSQESSAIALSVGGMWMAMAVGLLGVTYLL